MKEILQHLFSYKSFTQSESEAILTDLAMGKYNSSQMAAFLSAYAMRGITVPELKGFRDAMLNLCIPVNLNGYHSIDVCGTGGDGKNTFNISTLTSFILAGAGYKVSKHGNYGISSVSGSSNILEYFGYKFTDNVDHIHESIEKTGICFLHAPLFHPAMKSIAPIRMELGVKTFFNMLGPLVNPSRPKTQMIGVFSLELARLYHHLFQHSNIKYYILHSLDGYDEISLTHDIRYFNWEGEGILESREFVQKPLLPSQIQGGKTLKESADMFYAILDGKGTEAQNAVVVANAAMAIRCLWPDKTIPEAMEESLRSLVRKKAKHRFSQFLELNESQNYRS